MVLGPQVCLLSVTHGTIVAIGVLKIRAQFLGSKGTMPPKCMSCICSDSAEAYELFFT